jgi:hypothetical protein
MRPLATFAVACLLAAFAGCATHSDRLLEIRSRYYTGDIGGAEAEVLKQLEHDDSDADVLRLDRAIIELTSGRPADAERTLREVRDRFDHLEQKSLAESAASFLTDDNTVAYAGEDYEKVLIRALLAMSNLMHDGGDAGAYGLQTMEKQQQIIDAGAQEDGKNPKLAYQRVALGAYVHGLLREETHAHYDDAARASAMVVSWQPDFEQGRWDLQRAESGRHSEPGNGVVYVFTLVGRGPYKMQVEEWPTTVAMLVADRIVSAVGNQTLPPTVAPIKVPRVVKSQNRIRTVRIDVDGRPAGQTDTVTDIGEIALQQQKAVADEVLGRAIARRFIKKGAIYAGKEVLGVQKGSLAGLGFDVLGVVWEATETADTRSWGLLPDKVQVLRLELPAGEHRLTLQAADDHTTCGPAEQAVVNVIDGRNSYVLANFPDSRLVGRIAVR